MGIIKVIKEVPKNIHIDAILSKIKPIKQDEVFEWLKDYVSLTSIYTYDPDMDNVYYLDMVDNLTQHIESLLPMGELRLDHFELRDIVNKAITTLAVAIVENRLVVPIYGFDVVDTTGSSILILYDQEER